MDLQRGHTSARSKKGRGRPARGRARAALVILGATALLVATAGTASARTSDHKPGSGQPKLLVDGLAGPLSIDVNWRGDVLVGQGFAGLVSKVSRNGQVTDLLAEEGASAVAHGPFGTVLYTIRTETGTSLLKVRLPNGTTRQIADVGAYEAANNPDAGNSYAAQGISDECAAQWPVDDFGPPTYTGQIDSNPYQLAVAPWGVYIADAGANAVFFSDWGGHLRTVAVFAPQPLTIPDDPSGLGLPACAAGLTYNFEPVPTDIELSWTGAYVSLLPGGPEDASLGARGSIVKLDLWSGRTRTIATGLLGATNVAVSPRGDVYATELFAGKVDKVTRHGLETVAELPEAAAVEWANGKLYVAHDAFGSGKISILRP